MKKSKHTHKFKRVTIGSKGWEVYKCQIPNCSTFLQPELVIGRLSLCCRCNSEITMTAFHARLVNPLCNNCDLIVNSGRRDRLEERWREKMEGKIEEEERAL